MRVNPTELHILDPSYYSTIYAGGGRRVNNDPGTVAAFAVPQSIIATVDHEHHRLRRSIMSPHFSKRAVAKREPLIHDKLDKFCERLDSTCDLEGKKDVVELEAAFAALTADIISHCFYGEDFNYLSSKDFKFDLRDAILGLTGFYSLTRFFPVFSSSLKALPIPILRILQPGLASLLTSQANIRREIQASMVDHKDDQDKDDGRSNAMIVETLKDPTVPPVGKAIERLGDEGTNILFAGTETTGKALKVIMFHLLHDKKLLKSLRVELDALPLSVKDDKWAYDQLQALPYLVYYTLLQICSRQGKQLLLTMLWHRLVL